MNCLFFHSHSAWDSLYKNTFSVWKTQCKQCETDLRVAPLTHRHTSQLIGKDTFEWVYKCVCIFCTQLLVPLSELYHCLYCECFTSFCSIYSSFILCFSVKGVILRRQLICVWYTFVNQFHYTIPSTSLLFVSYIYDSQAHANFSRFKFLKGKQKERRIKKIKVRKRLSLVDGRCLDDWFTWHSSRMHIQTRTDAFSNSRCYS